MNNTKDYFEVGYWCISLAILIATVYYIYYAPIKAVQVGRDLNNEQNKDAAKRSLFLTLFSFRGSPINVNFVNGLNQIDVVFNDSPTVLQAWHKYYDALHQPDTVNRNEQWTLLRVALLSEMAVLLGYGTLSQIDITKHYYPEGHEYQNRTDFEHKQAAYDYFKGGAELYRIMIDNHYTQPTIATSEDTHKAIANAEGDNVNKAGQPNPNKQSNKEIEGL